MYIVRGVVGFIRRTSSGHTRESSGLQAQKFSLSGPKIRFSDVGDEAIVNTLWERYEKADDKVEKKTLFYVFLKQFVVVYKDRKPVNSGIVSESGSIAAQFAENTPDDVVVGCSVGHPVEIIRILIEEITRLSSMITESNISMMQSTTDLSGDATHLFITSEGFAVLEAPKIVTRSLYNCRVFGRYGGIQKLTALMKGAVVQLKTINAAISAFVQLKTRSASLSADESLSDFTLGKFRLLDQILLYGVSIICNFIDLGLTGDKQDDLCCSTGSISSAYASFSSSNDSRVLSTATTLVWHQKAVFSVMEAGGLNWLVELLRIIRRLSVKEQWVMDESLQYFTLKILCLALFSDTRGQNHFKSIGGLEVLLDSLGFPSNCARTYSKSFLVDGLSDNTFQKLFRLHFLSLEVLREAVFGNVKNLQFLSEEGRECISLQLAFVHQLSDLKISDRRIFLDSILVSFGVIMLLG